MKMPTGLASNLKTLTRRYNALQKQLQALVSERQQREFEQALLVGLYDCWALLNVRGETACGELAGDEDLILMQCELLQSLTAAAAAAAAAAVPVAVDQQQGHSVAQLPPPVFPPPALTPAEADEECIAPRRQPMSFLEHILKEPLLEEIQTLTAYDIAVGFKDAMFKASLLLHRLDNEQVPYSAARQDTIKELASCWKR
jgi:DNA-binding protein YbaB